MADILKQFTRHMDGVNKAREYDAAAKAMAEHCDKRIAKARRALAREEKYLRKLVTSRTAGGVMRGDIEGAFGRMRKDLDLRTDGAENRDAVIGEKRGGVMAEITREEEQAAFDKLRDKIERVHPSHRKPDLVVMPKMTLAEWDAIFQFYRRNS